MSDRELIVWWADAPACRLGGDVAGAKPVTRGAKVPSPAPPGIVEPLGGTACAATMDQLPRRPLLAGEQGLSLSLAGAQAKLPVVPVTGILPPLSGLEAVK